MRLWSLHPKYLDPKGLVALWREALLAQAVLLGQTRGYQHHPQLNRFRETSAPAATLAAYLQVVHAEATRRGYSFDGSKIGDAAGAETMTVPRGQLDYEWAHLCEKLRVRAPALLEEVRSVSRPQVHPLFRIVKGGIADWEVVSPR